MPLTIPSRASTTGGRVRAPDSIDARTSGLRAYPGGLQSADGCSAIGVAKLPEAHHCGSASSYAFWRVLACTLALEPTIRASTQAPIWMHRGSLRFHVRRYDSTWQSSSAGPGARAQRIRGQTSDAPGLLSNDGMAVGLLMVTSVKHTMTAPDHGCRFDDSGR
jgi:hypothetical protein